MNKIYISCIIGNEKRYLQSIYPINWSPFISGAMSFSSIEEARLTLNCIYKNLFNDEEFTIESLYSIRLITVMKQINGPTTSNVEVPYIFKEGC